MAKWLTVDEAARMSGYHPQYVRVMLREGRFDGVKTTSLTWLIDRQSLQSYMQHAIELAMNGDRTHMPRPHRSRTTVGTPAENAPQPHHDALEPLHEL